MLFFALIFSSCNHKDLYYFEFRKSKVEVVYDWHDAPEANPKGMCVFFYSVENPDSYYRFDFDNNQGGEIEIPAGRYKLITYNNDTEVVHFSATNNFDSHMAYTREADLLEPLYGNGIKSTTTTTNGERVIITPDDLWGCHTIETVTGIGIQTITLYPHDMLCHYSYEVRNVENTQYISKISASLSGMAPTMNLSDESLGSEHITLPVAGSADTKTNRITGQFLTFGRVDDTSIPHKMAFFVVMNDGSKYRIEGDDNLDVSSQVDNAPDKRHVHIIIDGLKVPQPSADEEGWDPTVDDWGISREDLKI